MNASLSGKRTERHDASVWLPGAGKYLVHLKLATLRDYLHALFVETPGDSVTLERGTVVLQGLWRGLRLLRQPKRSHAYRHLLALQLLGLIKPHGNREGYVLASLGETLLGLCSPGSLLQEPERRLFANAMFAPPGGMQSPLLAFAELFAPGSASADEFVACGQPITLRRYHPAHLEIVAVGQTVVLRDADSIAHVLWGCRELFAEAGLIGEIPSIASPQYWQRILFPVQEAEESHIQEIVEQVVSCIRHGLRHSLRLPIPALTTEVRPKLKLTQSDYERIVTAVANQHAGEFYFDRLSAFLISGHEGAYVRVGGYWRASVVRCG